MHGGLFIKFVFSSLIFLLFVSLLISSFISFFVSQFMLLFISSYDSPYMWQRQDNAQAKLSTFQDELPSQNYCSLRLIQSEGAGCLWLLSSVRICVLILVGTPRTVCFQFVCFIVLLAVYMFIYRVGHLFFCFLYLPIGL